MWLHVLISWMAVVIYKCFKWILHQITGKCEIERICTLGNKKSYEINNLLALSFRESLQLKHLKLPRQATNFDEFFFIESVKSIKAISKKTTVSLHLWLTQEMELVDLLATLSKLANESYSSQNSQHESLLEQLWQALKPGIHRSGRITKEWQQIGFQGNDPQTDFRSMGMLALQSLLYFSTIHPASAREAVEQKDFAYPFAIGGISVLKNVLDLCKNGEFDWYFFKQGTTLEQFYELFSQAMVLFSQFYELEQPPNIMHFELVMKRFIKKLPHIVK